MKTQKIKRTDLKIIYDNVCEGWKTTISSELLWNTGSVINFSQELIDKGYKQANSDQKILIEKYFKIEKELDLFSVTSFSQLCKLKNIKEATIADFSLFGDLAEKMLAFWQIKIIEKVYNNGWVADFSNTNQYKYYPYFVQKAGGLEFDGSNSAGSHCDGSVGLFKSREISDFVGKTFIKIYQKVI